MNAGRRNQLIILQRYTAVQDELGEEVPTWSELGSAWAMVFYGKGDERRQAAVEEGKQSATFRVLATTLTRGVGIKDRISHLSSLWDIVGIAPMDRTVIEFTAVRAL